MKIHNDHPFCRFLAPLSDTPYFVVKTATREAEGQHVSTTAIVVRAYDQPFDNLRIALKVDTSLCLEIVCAVCSNQILPISTHLVWSGLVAACKANPLGRIMKRCTRSGLVWCVWFCIV